MNDVQEIEADVLDVLHRRRPETRVRGALIPAWALHLARAEAHDRAQCAVDESRMPLDWRCAWQLAGRDAPWQVATNGMATIARSPSDPFFMSWVDSWLARYLRARVYPADPNALRALCALTPRDPEAL